MQELLDLISNLTLLGTVVFGIPFVLWLYISDKKLKEEEKQEDHSHQA